MALHASPWLTPAVALLGLVAPVSASARTATVLQPVTPWMLDYSPTACTLKRGFGDKAKPALLMVERFKPSTKFQLALLSEDLPKLESQGAAMSIRFGAGEKMRTPRAMPGHSDDGRRTITISSASLVPIDRRDDDAPEPAVSPEQEAAATSISVEYLGRNITFATGPLDKVFAEMRKCTDDLVRSWGLDPAQQASLSSNVEPLRRPETWITSDSYPPDMLMHGKQGLVNFRLAVDDKGVPSACEIQRSYGDPEFDQVTCQQFMRRARFSPARDASGTPVASYYIHTVVFLIP